MATTLLLIGLLCWPGEPPAPSRPEIPYAIALEVARLESLHRSILSGPVGGWQLEPVRSGYEALLEKAATPESRQILEIRLQHVGDQIELAKAARTVRTLLDRTHRRDRDVAQVHKALDGLERASKSRFAAVGQIQPSSRQIDGRRVFALIGKKGYPIAYLDVPPGLDAQSLTARRVGVRGLSRYNEDLGRRLITVRDLEALDEKSLR